MTYHPPAAPPLTAMEQAKLLLGAMADAGRRADQAMRDGCARYDGRTAFARRNLLERWYTYAGLTRLPVLADDLNRARQNLRRAATEYRFMMRGIDTSTRAA